MDRSKIVFAAVAAVVLLAAGALAFLAKGNFASASNAENEAQQEYTRLKAIYNREIFPNDENVAILAQSVADLDACRAAIADSLASCNPRIVTNTTPSQFVQTLDTMTKALYARAPIVEGSKCVSENFAYGFDAYRGGINPADAEVPLLTQQLLIANRIANAMFQSKVSNIISFRRDAKDARTIEAQAQSSAETPFTGRPAAVEEPEQRPKGKGKANRKNAEPEVPLFTCQGFGIEFKARDSAVVSFLNALASMKELFIVVTDISVVKEGDDVRPPVAEKLSADSSRTREREARHAEAEARRPARAERTRTSRIRRDRGAGTAVEEKAPPKPTELPAELRKVSGPELDPLLTVKMQLEIYSFAKEGE